MGGGFVIGQIANVILGSRHNHSEVSADAVTALPPTDFQHLQDLKMFVPLRSDRIDNQQLAPR